MKYRMYILVIFLVSSLTFCTRAGTDNGPLLPTEVYQGDTTETNGNIYVTKVPLSTSSPTIAATPTPTLYIPYNKSQCPSVAWEIKKSVLMGNSLIFLNAGDGISPGGIWVFSGDTMETVLIHNFSSTDLPFVVISEDGRYLAWESVSEELKSLIIYDLELRQIDSVPWGDNWRKLEGWTEEGQIIILVTYEDVFEIGNRVSYIYFDFHSGREKLIENEYNLPGYLPPDGLFGGVVVDPSGSHAIYQSTNGNLTLRDLVRNETLWEYNDYIRLPSWSRDGTKAALALRPDSSSFMKIYQLSKDGVLLDLTPKPLVPDDPGYVISDLSWSPNSKYIHYSLFGVAAEFIYVLDSTEVIPLCGSEGGIPVGWGVWGTKTNHYYYGVLRSDGTKEILLLDIENKVIYQLDEGTAGTLDIIGETPFQFP